MDREFKQVFLVISSCALLFLVFFGSIGLMLGNPNSLKNVCIRAIENNRMTKETLDLCKPVLETERK